MIGKRIQLLRKSSKLNQTDFGKLFGVSKQCVSNWESSRIIPSANIIKEIAIHFNVSTDFIFGIDENKYLDVSKLTLEEKNTIQFLIDALTKNKAK